MPECARCPESVAPDDPAALAWAHERAPDGTATAPDGTATAPDGTAMALCPACARRHVRDIEARLAPEWW